MEFSFAKCLLVVGLVLLLHKGDVQAQVTLAVTTQNLAENAAVATTVETLAGSGGTGPYTFTLLTTTSDFEISTADLRTLTVQDFETPPNSFTLEIQVVDSVPATATVSFTVVVTDVDEAPTFASSVGYASEVADNAPAGTTVGTFTATDVDAGAAGTISSYAIGAGNTGTTFAVSAAGVITVDTGKTANALPYLIELEARGTLTGTTTIAIVAPFCTGSATANSIGIMALVPAVVFQAMKYL